MKKKIPPTIAQVQAILLDQIPNGPEDNSPPMRDHIHTIAGAGDIDPGRITRHRKVARKEYLGDDFCPVSGCGNDKSSEAFVCRSCKEYATKKLKEQGVRYSGKFPAYTKMQLSQALNIAWDARHEPRTGRAARINYGRSGGARQGGGDV